MAARHFLYKVIALVPDYFQCLFKVFNTLINRHGSDGFQHIKYMQIFRNFACLKEIKKKNIR